MNKEEFLNALRSALAGLPQEDIEERLAFYSESIDDRVEDGLTEEEAVEAIGTVAEVRELALVGGVIAGVGGTVMYLKEGNFVGALFYAGAAVLCAGLAILLFFGCIKLTKAVVKLTARMLLGIKNSFVGKEA